MIKNSTHILLESLTKLFNFVFEKGEFPKIWNETFIVPLHKTGSKSDPSNYRGLSISSNLGKAFNKIIHLRLIKFTLDNNQLSKNQIGFMEHSRTADHIFSLKSIIEHYKLKKKKVYAAFIDLKKAFDTIWRLGLFYILLKNGVPKKIFNIIHSMYSNTINRLKFNEGLS